MEEKRRTLEIELGDGTLDGELLAGLHLVHVLGHLALFILFDEEGELTRLVGGRDWSVRANDGLALGVKERVGRVGGGLDDDA